MVVRTRLSFQTEISSKRACQWTHNIHDKHMATAHVGFTWIVFYGTPASVCGAKDLSSDGWAHHAVAVVFAIQ